MATKFELQPKPTFKANVEIPRAGEDAGVLTFTFRHKSADQIKEMEKREGATAVDFLSEIIEGWALPEPYTRENLTVLLDNYLGAAGAITEQYYAELMGHREKN